MTLLNFGHFQKTPPMKDTSSCISDSASSITKSSLIQIGTDASQQQQSTCTIRSHSQPRARLASGLNLKHIDTGKNDMVPANARY